MNKLTNLEELQLRKKELQVELEMYAQRLDKELDYLQHNLGSLVVNTATGAICSKMPIFSQGFFSSPKEIGPAGNRPIISPVVGVVIDQLVDVLPLFFKGFKPMLITFAVKKIKKIFFK